MDRSSCKKKMIDELILNFMAMFLVLVTKTDFSVVLAVRTPGDWG